MTTETIAQRFERETADHQMTVLHDDGLYRHLHFEAHVWRPPLRKLQRSSFYWFDLITVPGCLIFQGDGASFTFRRDQDMFEFFRGQRINPSYWAEKVTSGQEQITKYDEDLFTAIVNEAVAEAIKDDPSLSGLADAVKDDVLESWDYSIMHRPDAMRAAHEFVYYKNPDDRYDLAKHPDFQFSDIGEWVVEGYHWWFLWALHGIVWGISRYDAPLIMKAAPTASAAAA